MATWLNGNAGVYRVENLDGNVVDVLPGGTVESTSDLSGDGFTNSDSGVVYSGSAVNVSGLAADWVFPRVGNYFDSLQFNPGAISDRLIVRDGSATGDIIFDSKASLDGTPMARAFGGQFFKPYIKLSECVLSAGYLVIFIIDRSK